MASRDAVYVADVGRLFEEGDNVERALGVLVGLPHVECAAWIRYKDESVSTIEGVFPRLLPGAPMPPWLDAAIGNRDGAVGEWTNLEWCNTQGRLLLRLSNSCEQDASAIAVLVEEGIPDEVLGYSRAIAMVSLLVGRSGTGQLVGSQLQGDQLRGAMLILGAANHYDKPKPAYRAICDAFVSHLKCDRASLGSIEGGSARVMAVSHAEKVTERAAEVRAIGEVMEECIDQDAVIMAPEGESEPVIRRAAMDLALIHGSSAHVLALPVAVGERAIGAVVLERYAGVSFSDSEQQRGVLTCELLSRRLASLFDQDRSLLSKCRDGTRRKLARLIGPTHTWVKLSVILIGAFLLMSLVVRGQDHASASATIVATETRSVAAPYAGFVSEGFVEEGDTVIGGETVVAVLDTSQLELELLQANAEQQADMTDAAHHRDQMRTAEAAIAEARAEEVRAGIQLLEYQIGSATLVAPIDGVVVEGNARQLGGASVGLGQQIVRIANPETVYLRVAVPEREMRGVDVGRRGKLVTPAFPGEALEFEVVEVSSVISEKGGTRALIARATVLDAPSWLMPGMEGDASIRTVRRPLMMVWTRRLTDWLKIKLWL